MRKNKFVVCSVIFALFFIFGCTKKNFVSLPDSYNDQGRELIYAEDRIEGKHCCGSFFKFNPNIDFQAAIDNAIEKGQKKFGEEYIAFADIIAWYEVTNYGVYSAYCAKVSGWPARFSSDMINTSISKMKNLPTIYKGKHVYYHSVSGTKNNFDNFKYNIKNTENLIEN